MMDQFKKEIEAFMAKHGVSASGFGRMFLNDPGFVYRLRNGAECRPSTIDRVRGEMRSKSVKSQSPSASAPLSEAS